MPREKSTWLSPAEPAKTRNGWAVLLLSIFTIGIYTIAWIHRLHREFPRRQGVDPRGRIWLSLFWGQVVLMLGALLGSGYGQWKEWSDASAAQQGLFALGLGVAVILNLWFAMTTARLTDRFSLLLEGKASKERTLMTKLAAIVGFSAEMVAMIVPLLGNVGLVDMTDAAYTALDFTGKLGAGALLSWGIAMHRQANVLAAAKG
jgi:hypothetical protein